MMHGHEKSWVSGPKTSTLEPKVTPQVTAQTDAGGRWSVFRAALRLAYRAGLASDMLRCAPGP
jgi:hypothetical protein